jgi:flagellar biosynthesis/type III secretory pathway M-ring protein FliF/YscJ
MESARMMETALSVGRIVAMVLGPLIVLFFIRQMLRDKSPRSRVIPLAAAGRSPEQLEAQRTPAIPVRNLRDAEHAHVQEEVQAFARSEPAAVAEIVRTWLREDQAAL